MLAEGSRAAKAEADKELDESAVYAEYAEAQLKQAMREAVARNVTATQEDRDRIQHLREHRDNSTERHKSAKVALDLVKRMGTDEARVHVREWSRTSWVLADDIV